MKRKNVAAFGTMVLLAVTLAACGSKEKGDVWDEELYSVEAVGEKTAEAGKDTGDADGIHGIISAEEDTYTADIEGRKITFRSAKGLHAAEPIDAAFVESQSFYTKDARQDITVTYISAEHEDLTLPRTAEEYLTMDRSGIDPWITPLYAEDVTFGEWSGFKYEYHDEGMKFNAMGYELFHESGESIWFSQNRGKKGYLPLDGIEIE